MYSNIPLPWRLALQLPRPGCSQFSGSYGSYCCCVPNRELNFPHILLNLRAPLPSYHHTCKARAMTVPHWSSGGTSKSSHPRYHQCITDCSSTLKLYRVVALMALLPVVFTTVISFTLDDRGWEVLESSIPTKSRHGEPHFGDGLCKSQSIWSSSSPYGWS